jgi:peptide/nickel transport system substrate-binding protein
LYKYDTREEMMYKKLLFILLIGCLIIAPVISGSAAVEPPVKMTIIPPGRLTPGFMSGGAEAIFASCVYDWLFRIVDGDVVPSLVKEYSVSADGKTWTMQLREGVKFHDGTHLTAEDVTFTVKRWLDPDLGTALYGVFKDLIKEVEAIDEYTVRFILATADPSFNLKMLDYNAAILSSEYDYVNKGETHPMGSGAFRVSTYVPLERAELLASEDYWLKDVPYIDKLVIEFIPELETQVSMIEAGETDIITDISIDQYRRLEQNPNVTPKYITLGHHVTLTMRADKPPFDDPRIREAFKLVVDRQQMLDAVMYGLGKPGNDTPFYPDHPYYDDLGGIRQQDIEKAKELLAEAGYPNGLDVTIYCGSNIPPVLDVVLTYQQMAKAAGINVQINTTTRDIYLAKYWLPADFKATLWGHREDICQLLNLRQTCAGAWNEGHYCNEELDEFITKACSEVDEENKKEYFSKVQQILHNDGPEIILFFQPYFGATSNRIEGLQLTRNWINDYRFIRVKD